VDIASMACSLEVRSPFMDHKVAEFAAALEMPHKLKGTTRKRILRETFKDMLPKELGERGKMGFGVPVASWLRGEWRDVARERLLDGKAVSTGFFRRDVIEGMLDEHVAGQADHSYRLWALLVLDIWLDAQ